MDSIPEEERKKIFEEESKIKIVEVDSSTIELSIKKKCGRKADIIVVIIFGVLFIYSFILWIIAIIIGIIACSVAGLIIQNLYSDTIKFKCPYCGNERSLQMTDNSKVDNSNFLHNHNIYAKSNVKSELSCSKCHRKYEFRYTYLNERH